MNKNFPVLPVEIWDMIEAERRRAFKRRVAEFEIESKIYIKVKTSYVLEKISFNYAHNYKVMRKLKCYRRDFWFEYYGVDYDSQCRSARSARRVGYCRSGSSYASEIVDRRRVDPQDGLSDPAD